MKSTVSWLNLDVFGLTRGRVALFMGVAFGAAGCDGFSMAMILPVLQFIEQGQDPVRLASASRQWAWIVETFTWFGLPVTLIGLLVTMLALMLLRTGMNYVRQCYSVWVTQEVQHSIRVNLFSALAEAEYGHFDTLSTGRFVNLVSTEAIRASGYVGALFSLVIQGVLIAGLITVLLWVNPSLTFFTICVLAIGAGMVIYFVRHTRRLSRAMTDSNANLSFLLVERLTGIRLLKLSAVTRREEERIRRASVEVRDHYYLIQKLNARVEVLMDPVVAVLGLSILFVSVQVFHMSLAEVGLFMLILLRLMPLAKEVMRSRQSLHACHGGVAATLAGLDEARARREEDHAQGRPFTGLAEGIRFQGVEFTYPGQPRPALDKVDMFIPANRITALVGPSGAGKSTLVDILPCLRLPDSGTILFDGVPLGEFDLASLRRGMAFVSQDTFILNDSVRANLCFARREAGERELLEALEQARAREFVESLPQGLDTVLGERGVTLSGGQRQRLSLARALVQNAPLLILDEPTSALDSEVEQDIQQAIEEMRRQTKVTIIIIAHRLSTIRNADRIIVLKDGLVVEQGTHRELMVSEEWYAKASGLQNGRDDFGRARREG